MTTDKSLKIYNSLNHEIEEFTPVSGNKVFMYVCGPTVYDYMHIGHMKTYIFYDVLARYLSYKGYSVYFLMNITDVDDKIINRSIDRKALYLLKDTDMRLEELAEKLGLGVEYARERVIELIKSGLVELADTQDLRRELIELEKKLSLVDDEIEERKLEEQYEALKDSITPNRVLRISENGKKIIDEIISRGSKLDPIGIAKEFEEYFREDMKKLGITTINVYARASEFIEEIISVAKKLEEEGYAYDTPNALYFNSSKFKDYGKLSGVDPDREYRVHRIELDPNKKNDADWALWRKIKKGHPREPCWDSPWGVGRPGWHIEDTTIILRLLGSQIDIHGGAKELMFPHHEAEIAQAEAYTKIKPWVKFWVHTDVLTVNGKKMSKSLGNYISVRDALKVFDPEVLRYWVLLTKYRHRMDLKLPFEPDLLNPIKPEHLLETPIKQAEQGLERIYNVIRYASFMPKDDEQDDETRKLGESLEYMKKEFLEALDDDLDTPRAIATLHEFATIFFKYCKDRGKLNKKIAEEIVKVFRELGSILNILQKEVMKLSDERMRDLVDLIVDIRDKLRKRGEYSLADEIRERLRSLGIILEDTAKETRWYVSRESPS
ncbi:MAG: cysteine--tRNA ligase [Aigarchaeota archaeon]|nr:cysteine--tRNA ligase [Aigarchaeota archaeon]MCX8192216.1 cysteine--tRNA ligase [Nitrososphaeria archaeon]MDW7986176.1 cysteine--tRNA ligase [Nitrososphaerota archaeon]